MKKPGRGAAPPLVGFHAVQTALRNDPEQVVTVWVDRGRRDARVKTLCEQAERAGVALQRVDRAELERRAGGSARHQGVVADYAGAVKRYGERELDQLIARSARPLLLVLDGVQDPHNLGACLRSAAAAGATALVTPDHHSVDVTPTVHKVASGGAGAVPVARVTNLARTLRRLREQGVWLIGAAAAQPQTLYDVDLSVPCALLLGGEQKGLRPLTRECCDLLVEIPMAASPVESLNVSVAAGVLLFEALRQRRAVAAAR